MPSIDPSERGLIIASVVNGLLGTAIGVLAAGMSGAKIGLIVGLMVAVLPLPGVEHQAFGLNPMPVRRVRPAR